MGSFQGMGADQVVMVVIPALKYNEKISEVLKAVNEARIVYVTVNKPHGTILQNLKKEHVDTGGISFIDATGKKGENEPNCVRVDSPTDLIQLEIKIFEVIKEKKPNVVVFDSITTLAIYNDELSVLKFVHRLATKIRDTESKLLLPCLGDNSTLVKDSSMFADAVISID